MPTKTEFLVYAKMGEELGSELLEVMSSSSADTTLLLGNIFSLSIPGATIVILNDVEDAINLFEKRSAIYSDRSCPPMMGDPSL